MVSEKQSGHSQVTIAVPGAWGSLIPPTQHTMLGDAILGNEFEPLVDMEHGGMIVPFAAKSWDVSEDLRTITFKIDTSRRFSDGSYLSAVNFKESWEDGLRHQATIPQKSQMDVAYKIVGIENFAKLGTLTGLQVIDNETLRVTFKTPFRMALDHMTGSRFAAYKIKDGRYIGTGPYVIVKESADQVELERNTYHSYSSRQKVGADQIKVVRLTPAECESAIVEGKIDVYAYAGRNFYQGPCDGVTVGCLRGFEAGHVVGLVNGNPDRTFADPRLRLALQYLLTTDHNGVTPRSSFPQGVLTGNAFDPQPFIPLQAGRLPDEEAATLIHHGKAHVESLVEASRQRPIKWLYAVGNKVAESAVAILKRHGVVFENPKVVSTAVELQQLTDVKADPDLAFISKSVVDGDPDGIYHALGKEGAILTPMTLRPEVSELLEAGRVLTEIEKLDAHYRKVSRAILTQVPWVHLGYAEENTIYRADRISVNFVSIRSRVREPFFIFVPK